MRKDFAYLQKRIDAIISSIGIEGFINYLDIISLENDKDKVSSFILTAVGKLYKTPVKKITKEESKTDTEQRMIISLLLKKYLKLSIRKIGEIVKRKEEPVSRYLKDMAYYLEKPSLNQKLVNNYFLIETQVKQFIHFIEINKDGKIYETKGSNSL